MEFKLPDEDLDALKALCREQLRSGGWYERAAEAKVGADCLRKLRDCQLARVNHHDRVGGTTAGWAIAFPDCVTKAHQLLEALRLAVLERRVEWNFEFRSEALASLFSSLAPQPEVEITEDLIRVTHAIRSFRPEGYLDRPARLPVAALSTLWGYGVRTFGGLIREPGGGRPLNAGPYVNGRFIGCDFAGARLSKVVFEACEFHGCRFDGCDFSGGSIRSCLFAGGSFKPAVVHDLAVDGARFGGGCRVDATALSRSARFDHFEISGRVVARTRVVILHRPLGWEVFFDGESLGSVDLTYVPPLSMLVGVPGAEVSTMDLAIASECAAVPALGHGLEEDQRFLRVETDDSITKEVLSQVLSGFPELEGTRISKLWSSMKAGSEDRRRLACCVRGYLVAHVFEQLPDLGHSRSPTYIPDKKAIAAVIEGALRQKKFGSLNTSIRKLGTLAQGLRDLRKEGVLTQHPALVVHLEESVQTGEICCYRVPKK